MDVEPLALEFFRRNVWPSFERGHSFDQAFAFSDRQDLMLNRGDEFEVADEGRFVRAEFMDGIGRECALLGWKIVEPELRDAVEVVRSSCVADAALLAIENVILVISPQARELRGQRTVHVSPVRAKLGCIETSLLLQQPHPYDHSKALPGLAFLIAMHVLNE